MWPNQGVIAFDPHSGGAEVLSKLPCPPDVQRARKKSGRVDMRLEREAQKTAALNRILDQIGSGKGVKNSESLI